MTFDDIRALHRAALADADEFVAGLSDDDLRRATPCDQWQLGDLLAHMIGQHRGFAGAVGAGHAPLEAYTPVPFDAIAWRESVDALVSAFAAADLDARAVAIELGVTPIPIERIVGAHLLDTVVHTWDIAQAVGVQYVPPPDLLSATAAIAAAIPDPAFGPGRAFATRRPASGVEWPDTLAAVGRHLPVPAPSPKETPCRSSSSPASPRSPRTPLSVEPST